jgi:methyl-accepting chemotaxis protein
MFGIATISLRNRLARLGTLSSTSPASWISPRAFALPAMTNWAWWPACNSLLSRLQDSLNEINAAPCPLPVCPKPCPATPAQVASAASQQSSASANVAATVEQMTVSVNHVADRASEANSMTIESGKLASSGVSDQRCRRGHPQYRGQYP